MASLTRRFEQLKISSLLGKSENSLTIWGLPIPSKSSDYGDTSKCPKFPICSPLASSIGSVAPALCRKKDNGQITKVEAMGNSGFSRIICRSTGKISKKLEGIGRKAGRRTSVAPYSKHHKNKNKISIDKQTNRRDGSSIPKKWIDQSFDFVFGCSSDSLPSLTYSPPSSITSSDTQSPTNSAISLPEDANIHSVIPYSSSSSVLKERTHMDSLYAFTPFGPIIESSLDSVNEFFGTEMPAIPRFSEQLGFLSIGFPFSCDLPPPILSF